MKLINTISIFAFLTIINFSCVQDDDYSVPASIGQEENANLNQLLAEIENGSADLMTISQLKSFFVEGEVNEIESNLVVKGYVSSSDYTGNFYKEFYMQDEIENPTAGIKVSLNQVDSYNQFNVGREVYVKLQGLSIGETNSGDGVIAIGGGANEYGDELSESLQTDMVAGCVGEGVAVKFMAHRKIAGDLPVPEDVLDAKVKKGDNTEVSAMYALATSLCYELRDSFIAGEKAGAKSKEMDKYHKRFSNFISFMMDNFETEMVVMASRIAMQQYKLVPKQQKIERFDEYFNRYGRLVLDA